MKTTSYHIPLRQVFIGLLASCALMFGACDDDDETAVTALSLSEETLAFNADGGSGRIWLTAGDEWTVVSDREWCLVSPANGLGSTVCEIRVDSSYLYNERNAHLTFRCGNYSRQITVKQLGYEKVIQLGKEEIEVSDFTSYDTMFEEIEVTSNVNYDIAIEYEDASQTDWLRVTPEQPSVQSIPRPRKIRIDYELYTESANDRVASIVFRQTDAKEGETPIESRLTFRQKRAQEIIPSRQGDSLALLALARIMNCSVNWDTSQPMIFWPNVTLEEVEYINQQGEQVEEMRVTGVRFIVFNTNKTIPYQIRKLDQLRTFILIGNENSFLKNIKLEDDITYLPHLKRLALTGVGITELPERMAQMTTLEELELSGNKLTQLPIDIISSLDKHNLLYVNIANNRVRDVFGRLNEYASVKDTMGLHGTLPKELFQLKNVLYLGLSYNYFEGELPDMGYDASIYPTLEEKVANNPIMPQLEQLSLNLNFFTGRIPDWILYHRHLMCWDPYTLVFNQYENGKNSAGVRVGFLNEPSAVLQPCTLWSSDDEEETTVLTRANSFNPNFKFPMEIDVDGQRYPWLSLEGGWHVNYIPLKPLN